MLYACEPAKPIFDIKVSFYVPYPKSSELAVIIYFFKNAPNNFSHNKSASILFVKNVSQLAPVKSRNASLVKPDSILRYPPCIFAHAFSNIIAHNLLLFV